MQTSTEVALHVTGRAALTKPEPVVLTMPRRISPPTAFSDAEMLQLARHTKRVGDRFTVLVVVSASLYLALIVLTLLLSPRFQQLVGR